MVFTFRTTVKEEGPQYYLCAQEHYICDPMYSLYVPLYVFLFTDITSIIYYAIKGIRRTPPDFKGLNTIRVQQG